jgi:2-polyprenyl-3-methyl-5-hydroxy-6-metoxy-1,4-benzoquinol methylase/predicted phosphodiesterase
MDLKAFKTSTDPEFDVFISYSNDDEDLAQKLKNTLVENSISIWTKEGKLIPSDLHSEFIKDGIYFSRTIVFVISMKVISSGWIKKGYISVVSALIEDEKSRPIIPVLYHGDHDIRIPSFLQNRHWIDFRNGEEYDIAISRLVLEIRSSLDEACIGPIPEGGLHLANTMLEANKSLILSGHTLDKFIMDLELQGTLSNLLLKGVRVTIILLNPYSIYSRAHEPFHFLESRSSAHAQIIDAIKFFKNFFETSRQSIPLDFKVLLTNYMPRFRTIIIDEEICYISLYMYGIDVVNTPEFKLKKKESFAGSKWFDAISNSTSQMINSTDVIPLINNGRFNEDWQESIVADILNNCVKNGCCREEEGYCPWLLSKKIVLAYQNKNHKMSYESYKICKEDYSPGTFTLDVIPPTIFDDWLKSVVDHEVDAIGKLKPNLLKQMKLVDLYTKVRTALNSGPGFSLKHEIWYQEYSDIIRRLIYIFLTGNPDLDLIIYPELTGKYQDLVFKLIDYLEKENLSLENWLHLSIAAGLLGVNKKPTHAATSTINRSRVIEILESDESDQTAIGRIAGQLLDVAKTESRIDATNIFLHTLEMNKNQDFRIVSFTDDYLETIILLKFYEKLIKRFVNLNIYCVPRSIQCGNDATYDDLIGFINKFPDLQREDRFHVSEYGTKIGGVNLFKLHDNVMGLIEKSSILDVRGARNYEMMQGINKEAYFGFMVCRGMSELVTGLHAEDCPFIYLRQGPGEKSFDGFEFESIKADGLIKAKVAVTANDHKYKWEGGYLRDFNLWPEDRKERYRILRIFYSTKYIQFDSEHGDFIEDEVKTYLDAFDGRILVIGCGTGKEVKYLSDKGCDVFGIDFSPEVISFARKKYPNLKDRFFVEDMYNIDIALDGEFDGIVANATLVHMLDRNDISDMLSKISNRLKINGLLFIRILEKKDRNGNNIKEEIDRNIERKYGEPRWFVYYSDKELIDYSQKAGFILNGEINKRLHTKHNNVYWISALLNKSISEVSTEYIFTANQKRRNVDVLRILHLSDLHITKNIDVKTILQPLITDLKADTWPDFDRLNHRLDCIVISGDFTNEATEEEFNNAREFVSQLADEFKLSTDANCILVPGNHDQSWGNKTIKFYDVEDETTVDKSKLKNDNYYNEKDSRFYAIRIEDQYTHRFDNFSKYLYQPIMKSEYPLDFDNQNIIKVFESMGVLFLALNSSWEIDKYFQKRANIHDGALARGLEKVRKITEEKIVPSILKIALLHHPVTGDESIQNQNALELLKEAGFKLALHGHIHEEKDELLYYLHSNSIHTIGAGSFGAPVNTLSQTIPRLYNLLEVSSNNHKVRVHTRSRHKDGAWGPYSIRNGDKPGESKSYYDI